MELSPATYRCEKHGKDLTEAVWEQLTDRVPVAFGPGKPRPFSVIVTCPAGPHAHRLQFAGQIVSHSRGRRP